MCEQCTSKTASYKQVTYNGLDIKRALAENPEILRDLHTLAKVTVDSVIGEVDEDDALEAAGAAESISDGVNTMLEHEFEYTERPFCPNPLCENSRTSVSDETESIWASIEKADEVPIQFEQEGFQSANFLSTVISAQEQKFNVTSGETPAIEQARQLVGSDTKDAEEMSATEVLTRFQQGYSQWREQVAKPIENITGGAEEVIRNQFYDAPEVEVPLLDETVTIESSSASRVTEVQTAVEGSDRAATDAIVAMCEELGIDKSKVDPQMSPDRFEEVVRSEQQANEDSNALSAPPSSSAETIEGSDQENVPTPRADGGDGNGVNTKTEDAEEADDVGDLVKKLRDEHGQDSGNGGNGGGGSGAKRENNDDGIEHSEKSDDVGDLVKELRDEYGQDSGNGGNGGGGSGTVNERADDETEDAEEADDGEDSVEGSKDDHDQDSGADDSEDDRGAGADTGRKEDDVKAENSDEQDDGEDPDGPGIEL